MNVLITGGAGFVAIHLSRALSERGHKTVLLDRPGSFEAMSALGPTIEGSVTDTALLSQAIKQHDITDIVHLASLLGAACADDPALGTSVNCVGTAAVFDAARRAALRRVVFASTVGALAVGDDLPRGDDRPLGANTIYGLTKGFCERLAEVFRSTHGFDAIVGLRFGAVYGPGRIRGAAQLQRLVERAALEDSTEIEYPDYPQHIDWTYISDAVAAIVAVLDAERLSRPVYNLSGDKRTVRDAVEHLSYRFPQCAFVPETSSSSGVAWEFETDNLRKDTAFATFTRLEVGLDNTANAVRQANGLPAVPE